MVANAKDILKKKIKKYKQQSNMDNFKDFYLCDETYSDLPNLEKVQDFFIYKGIKDFTTINLILR